MLSYSISTKIFNNSFIGQSMTVNVDKDSFAQLIFKASHLLTPAWSFHSRPCFANVCFL